jgi:hypothetical protein
MQNFEVRRKKACRFQRRIGMRIVRRNEYGNALRPFRRLDGNISVKALRRAGNGERSRFPGDGGQTFHNLPLMSADIVPVQGEQPKNFRIFIARYAFLTDNPPIELPVRHGEQPFQFVQAMVVQARQMRLCERIENQVHFAKSPPLRTKEKHPAAGLDVVLMGHSGCYSALPPVASKSTRP